MRRVKHGRWKNAFGACRGAAGKPFDIEKDKKNPLTALTKNARIQQWYPELKAIRDEQNKLRKLELLRAVEARYGIRADNLTKRWIGIRGYQDGGLVGDGRLQIADGSSRGGFFEEGGLIYAQDGELLAQGENYDNIERRSIDGRTDSRFTGLYASEGTSATGVSQLGLLPEGIYAKPRRLVKDIKDPNELNAILRNVLTDVNTGREIIPGFYDQFIPHFSRMMREHNPPVSMLENMTSHADNVVSPLDGSSLPGITEWDPRIDPRKNHIVLNPFDQEFQRNPIGVGS